MNNWYNFWDDDDDNSFCWLKENFFFFCAGEIRVNNGSEFVTAALATEGPW